jgi:hypothetical protein
MNKTAINKFSVWARRKLISDITYKAGLIGISENGILQPLASSTNDLQFFDIGTGKPTEIIENEIKQRDALSKRIREKESTSDYKTAFQFVVEEVAYTWFNRLIAIRFMEVNDYLPSRIRVLSSEMPGKIEPDMVTKPFETDMNFSAYETDKIMQLKDENKLDELFRMLFIKQCNKLYEELPELFEETSDYSELLLNIAFTDAEGIVSHLINDIDESDFAEAVEIIGWMYQYYNEERKNEVINIYKGTVKKDDIPAATQLFTTDWVVRYMVDNSLGRYWIERNPESKLQDKLQYFVTPKSGEIEYVNEKVTPEEMTFFDPCMGSGHILVYAFDVLMEIYRECGYIDRDAAQAIIENNLFGLDIDNRAYQLAYFAVMMKARSYDRRFLTRKIQPNVTAIVETNAISQFYCEGVTNDKEFNKIGEYLIQAYKHAKEIGSLISVEGKDYVAFKEYLDNCNVSGQITMDSNNWYSEVMPTMKKIAKQADIMAKRYCIVTTNPPYMNKLEGQLKKFVIEEYKPYSGDLFSVFMYKNFDYCRPNGYSAFMTPFVWMFIKTYGQLRSYIIAEKSISTLIQMEYSAFEEATVPICTFVLKNKKESEKGLYIKLSDFKGGMEVQKEKVIEAIANKECGYFYETSVFNYSNIPDSPIAYWISKQMLQNFSEGKKLGDVAKPRQGMATTNNDLFLRLWSEISANDMFCNANNKFEALESGKKWFPYNKGGDFRKWYGNNDYVVNWKNDGEDIKKYLIGKNPNIPRSESLYFKKCFSWSLISSGSAAFRYKDNGNIFDIAGMSCFSDEHLNYLLGLCNTKVVLKVLSVLAPTINYQAGDIANVPVILDDKYRCEIEGIVLKNIEISKRDWDSYENSWDFTSHPLISLINETHERMTREDKKYLIKDIFRKWEAQTKQAFIELKSNEEKLNKIFIDIYNLSAELTPEVEDRNVTIRNADRQRDIKSLISYAVGCLFGRYSLDLDGLAYAGGEWDRSKFTSFVPDKDNCIPITDEEYFDDDIVGRFIEFVKCVYGVDTLEENLDFVAKSLDNKGNTSREIIRNYFVKDFYKDHVKTYQKRPIYWMYDSGMQDGFKALVYMHRYTADTTGIVRVDYLHKMQKIYMNEIERMQEMVDNSANSREVVQAEKRKEKLIKQLKETKEYDEKIAHLALSRIEINLDDGVKMNYEKVQTSQDKKKLNILGKI